MDTKEAIKYLKSMLFTSDMSESTLKAIAVNKMAISALEKVETIEAENARLREKETPVKIRTETEEIYEPYDDVPIDRKVNLYCGKCGKPLNAYHDYCYWCGQAIKIDKE